MKIKILLSILALCISITGCGPSTPTMTVGPSGKLVDITGLAPRTIIQDPNNGKWFMVPVPPEQKALENRILQKPTIE